MATYRELVQDRRGIINNENTILDIDSVENYGSNNLIAFMIDTKLIGFRLASQIATELTHPLQNKLIIYMLDKKCNVKQIRLEFQRLKEL